MNGLDILTGAVLVIVTVHTHTQCSVATQAAPGSSAALRRADGMTERFCVIGGVIGWIELSWNDWLE